jgi:hypothetical protein
MRKDFPDSMPVEEQLRLSNLRKKVGRKHNHTIGPGKKKKKLADQKKLAAEKRRKQKVSAYWRGDSDNYPKEK